MSILIEAITTSLGLKKLEEGKALIKAQTAKVPIRINKNIAEPLLKKDLIHKRVDGFYELTQKGRRVKIRYHSWNLSLDDYLIYRTNIKEYISNRLRRRKPIYKIMVTTCLSCGEENLHLNHIADFTGADGSYCAECLKHLGYAKSRQLMLEREKKARCHLAPSKS